MKNIIVLIALLFVSMTTFANKFILTSLAGKKLKTEAYFYCGNQPTWTLDYRNGKRITYKILSGSSVNPLCGVETKDSLGDLCEICITQTSGRNAIIEFKYGKGTLTFSGYYAD